MAGLVLQTTEGLIQGFRPVGEADVEQLRLLCGGPPGLGGALRAKHHRIAQLVAGGMQVMDVAHVLAMDVGTLATLLRSTAMQSLVEDYRKDDVQLLRQRTKMAAAAGLLEVQRQLENPMMLDFKDIVGATEMLLDRSGVGPTTKHLIASAHLSREELLGINSDDRVIDVEPVGGEASIPETAREDERAAGGAEVREKADEVPSAERGEGTVEAQPLVH